MNVRSAFICLVLSALLSSGCVRPLEWGGADGPYNAITLALSLRTPGDVPNRPATKMSTAITQDGTGFRGIDQVYVIPFKTDAAIPLVDTTSRFGARNVVIQNPSIDALVANNNAHLYNIAILPRGMNRVLAYGKSADAGSVSTREGKHKNGVLTPSSGLNDPQKAGDISFSLEPILEEADSIAVGQTVDNLIAALNGVVEAIQASNNPDFLAFLDVFAIEDSISVCSYQTLLCFEQNIFGALTEYEGPDRAALEPIVDRLYILEDAYNEAGEGFPATYGIPEGAVGMWWNGHRFVKLLNGVNISLVPSSLYCYPPSLWYYANSSIQTSSDVDVAQQYNPQNITWGEILAYYTESTTVLSTSRSAAIVDQMQYGVGLVEFRFTLDESAAAAAADSLTGIIIGEQRDVDFSFSPISSPSSRFIYDNDIRGITLGGTEPYVQVLVLPTAQGEPVHFALEFENASSAFQCQQGTVLPGCKFYLAGELKPLAEDANVFSRDCKTTVNVTVLNLSKAYTTVPDLREPQLEIGVTVDLDWIMVEPGEIKLSY